jgi:hypothetical protein
MKLSGLRLMVSGLLTIVGMAMPVVLVTSCGGTSGNVGGASSDGGSVVEPNQQFECFGTINDTLQPADNLNFPTQANPEPVACVPPDSDAAFILQKCQGKCEAVSPPVPGGPILAEITGARVPAVRAAARVP